MNRNKKYLIFIAVFVTLFIVVFKVDYKGYTNKDVDKEEIKELIGASVVTTTKSNRSCTCTTQKSTAASCKTCPVSKCVGGYEDKNCSNCKTGSPNECVGGYVTDTSNCTSYSSCSSCGCKSYGTKYVSCATGSNTCSPGYIETSECQTLSADKYNSGNGGKNYYAPTVSNPVSATGVQSGNGKIIIEYMGE